MTYYAHDDFSIHDFCGIDFFIFLTESLETLKRKILCCYHKFLRFLKNLNKAKKLYEQTLQRKIHQQLKLNL